MDVGLSKVIQIIIYTVLNNLEGICLVLDNHVLYPLLYVLSILISFFQPPNNSVSWSVTQETLTL